MDHIYRSTERILYTPAAVVDPRSLVNRSDSTKSEKVVDHPLKARGRWMLGRYRRVSSAFGRYGQNTQTIISQSGYVDAINLAPQSEKRPFAGREINETSVPAGFVNVRTLPPSRFP